MKEREWLHILGEANNAFSIVDCVTSLPLRCVVLNNTYLSVVPR